MTRLRFAVLILTGVFCAASAPAQSPEFHVLCSIGIRPAIEQLTPAAEKAIGRKLSFEFSSSAALKKMIDGGAAFDLAILSPAIIDDLVNAGKVVPGSAANLASVDLGVGIKAGSPVVDISTPEGMKKRLLAAKTITWTDGGAAAPAILAMLKGLGIEEQMKPKVVLQKVPGLSGESVARGENELMFAPVSEILPVKGVQVLGVFPAAYQKPLFMTAGIGSQSKDASAAKALIAFLTSAKAAPAIQAAGLKPAPSH